MHLEQHDSAVKDVGDATGQRAVHENAQSKVQAGTGAAAVAQSVNKNANVCTGRHYGCKGRVYENPNVCTGEHSHVWTVGAIASGCKRIRTMRTEHSTSERAMEQRRKGWTWRSGGTQKA